jgi:NAD+ kinase
MSSASYPVVGSNSKRILLVSKTPLIQRVEPGVLARLAGGGAVDVERLKAAAANHEKALHTVRRALGAHRVSEWQVDRLQARDAEGKDLVVTVGGDGTVLTTNSLESDLPLITVNSDPEGSVGMYARCTADSFATLFQGWLAGSAQIEVIPRLLVRIDSGNSWRILNECLFASANPAAMSRYVLECDGRREEQRSSGVWVATAAGSTAAIRSAGMEPVEAHVPALLYQVREPFHGRCEMTMLSGRQMPPVGLKLMPAMPGISMFIDGPHLHRTVPPGATVEFMPCPTPLRLVRAP